MFYQQLIKGVLLLFLFLPVFLIPLFFLKESDILELIGYLFQIASACLFYIDIRYKRNDKYHIYGKANTTIIFIFSAINNIPFYIKQLYLNYFDKFKEGSNLVAEFDVFVIPNEVDVSLSEFDQLKQRIVILEDKVKQGSYFSEVQKAGYLLFFWGLSIKFINFLIHS